MNNQWTGKSARLLLLLGAERDAFLQERVDVQVPRASGTRWEPTGIGTTMIGRYWPDTENTQSARSFPNVTLETIARDIAAVNHQYLATTQLPGPLEALYRAGIPATEARAFMQSEGITMDHSVYACDRCGYRARVLCIQGTPCPKCWQGAGDSASGYLGGPRNGK